MRLIILACVLIIGFTASNLYAALPEIKTAILKNDYNQAKELSFQFLKSSSDPSQQAEARYYFGLAQLRLGQFTGARNAFQIVMDSHPSQDIYDQAALGIAEEYYLSGLYQDSLDTVNKLLTKNPHSSFLSLIYLKIAGNNLKLANWEIADEYLDKIINEFPQSSEAPIAKQLLEEKHFFTVQVGAFLDKERALAIIKNLNIRENKSYIVEIKATNGETFYRVRIGKMSSLTKANELKKEIIKLGYPALIYP